MKRIYITGIAGLLGANIAYLLKERYEITGVDKVPFHPADIQCECFDLLDYSRLRESIVRCAPDYLIHTAALVNVDFCEQDRNLAYQLNSELSSVLAKICKEISCEMVYISTDAVFDGENGNLYTEDDAVLPINQYGKTKLLGEEAVLNNGFLVVRTNIYGFNVQNKASFGEWIYQSLQRGEELNMFTDIKFSPILVNDLAEVLIQLLEKNKHGVYHVCASGSISKYDFGKYMQSVFSLSKGVIKQAVSDGFTFQARRSKDMGLSNSKVKTELGIEIAMPEESIQRFFELYSKKYHLELKRWGCFDENREDRNYKGE